MAEKPTKLAIINSSLWACYGDALGFITELADKRTLKLRVHSDVVADTVVWRRNIGGRFGVNVELPSGCYSDDTQLRLATSRAIRADGYFDVEAFGKVELPVWRAYALGAGRATKAAAASLANSDVNWFSNFFKLKDLSYLEGGGNGAAMRIQPHVWASRGSAIEPILRDVIRNCVCTHGHVRAIAGACFHALSLHSSLHSGEVPRPEAWRRVVTALNQIGSVIRSDNDLHSFWLPVWEQRSKAKFDDAVKQIQRECSDDLDRIEPHLSEAKPQLAYERIVESIGGLQAESRGSGIKTAILASVLSWLFRKESPLQALLTGANLLGSDTDTIATMAGAIMGATTENVPNGKLLDHDYLVHDATRLFSVSIANPVSSFNYPDLLKWSPPKTMLDAVELANGTVNIAGLGMAEPVGPKLEGRKDDGSAWQWMKLGFGQTVLVKQRKILMQAKLGNLNNTLVRKPMNQATSTKQQPELFEANSEHRRATDDNVNSKSQSIDSLTAEAIKSGFKPELIGRHLIVLAESPDGIELVIAYAAIVAKAKRARMDVQSREDQRLKAITSK